jgi:eukaryotic-like serine/threonine-protein kinase
VQHPGVVTLLEWGFVTDDRGARRAYHVFEETSTTTLGSRLSEDEPPPWPRRRALLFTADIAEALAQLHEVGIVAGSLAPSHIMVESDGRPRLLDAGLEPPDAARAVAPEVAAGEQPAPASDVYALGQLLFLLVTGEVHTAGARVVAGEGIDAGVAGLIAGMLAEDPARRPPSARAVAGRLRSLAEPAGRRVTTVAGEEVIEETHVPPTRQPGLGILVPLVLLAMVAAGVAAAYALTHDDNENAGPTVSTSAPVPTAPAPASTVTVTTTVPATLPTETLPTDTTLTDTTATVPTDTSATDTSGGVVPTATETSTVTDTLTTTTATTATVTTETTATAPTDTSATTDTAATTTGG